MTLNEFVARVQKLPLWVKIGSGVVLLMMVVIAAQQPPQGGARGRGDDYGSSGGRASYNGGATYGGGQQASSGDDRQAMIAQLEEQHRQLEDAARPCLQRIQQINQMQARAAMQGQFVPQDEACINKVQQITAQMAVVEAQIYRLKTGDNQSNLSDITGYRAPPSSRGSGSSNSGGSRSGDSSDAPERFDRNVIRGTSHYADNHGNVYELQTQPHYYRNESTGEIVPSSSAYPPNDGSNWVELRNLDDR